MLQVRRESRDASRAVPAIPPPSASKKELPKKDVSVKKHTETQDTVNKTKREFHVSSGPPRTHAQNPSALPTAGKSVSQPFHQPAVSMKISGHSPQSQSQGMPTSTLQIPMQMSLLLGNPAQVPQQVFMPSLQRPIMQT